MIAIITNKQDFAALVSENKIFRLYIIYYKCNVNTIYYNGNYYYFTIIINCLALLQHNNSRKCVLQK